MRAGTTARTHRADVLVRRACPVRVYISISTAIPLSDYHYVPSSILGEQSPPSRGPFSNLHTVLDADQPYHSPGPRPKPGRVLRRENIFVPSVPRSAVVFLWSMIKSPESKHPAALESLGNMLLRKPVAGNLLEGWWNQGYRERTEEEGPRGRGTEGLAVSRICPTGIRGHRRESMRKKAVLSQGTGQRRFARALPIVKTSSCLLHATSERSQTGLAQERCEASN